MIMLAFLQWWYVTGWMKQFNAIIERFSKYAEIFSIRTLILTLGAPWKQIIAPRYGDESLGARMRLLLDNIVSRAVGATVRLLFLFVAVNILIVVLALSSALVIIWPVLPVLPILLFVLGFGVL